MRDDDLSIQRQEETESLAEHNLRFGHHRQQQQQQQQHRRHQHHLYRLNMDTELLIIRVSQYFNSNIKFKKREFEITNKHR